MSRLQEFTPVQLNQLVQYLQFEKSKRREITTEVSVTLEETLSSKINPGDFYSGQDGLDLLEDLPSNLRKSVDTELQHQRDTIVVLLLNIFEQAHQNKIQLEFNISDLANEELTDEANFLSENILKEKIFPAAVFSGNLDTSSTEDSSQTKQYTEAEINAIIEENKRLKSQLTKNKREWPEFIQAQETLKTLNAEVHQLREKLGIN